MRLPPLSNAIMIAALVLAGAVQIALVLEFWSSFAGEDAFSKWVFQGLGIAFAIIEMVALAVCANAARLGAWARATAFRVVFVGLFAINLTCDIGAIYTFTTRDAEARAAALQASQSTEQVVEETRARIAALRETLVRQELDEPVVSLEIKRDAAVALRDQYGVGQRTQNWRTQRAATLEAALATAREIERLEGELEVGRKALLSRPQSASHPQTAALATILGWFGITASESTIRVSLALAIALVLRGVLAFGFWAATLPPGRKAEGQGRAGDPVQAMATPPTVTVIEDMPVASEEPPSNVLPFASRLRRPQPEPEPATETTQEAAPPAEVPPVKPDRKPKPKAETRKKPEPPRPPADLIDALDQLDDEFRPKD